MPEVKSLSLIDKSWYKLWIVKRDEPIYLTLSQQEGILKALDLCKKYVLVQNCLIMLNSIVLIEPITRPKQHYDQFQNRVLNQEEIDQWDKIFGNKQQSNYINSWLYSIIG